MPKKKNKKDWKERQHQAQTRQRAQVVDQREAKKLRKNRLKGTIIIAACLLVVITTAYVAWQYYSSLLPPSFGGGANNPPSIGPAPDFSLIDVNGTQFSLNQFRGKIIVAHFMAVGCGGQIDPINDYQLKQLKGVCDNYCGDSQVNIITVAVSTCANSYLVKMRADYHINWFLGNDYDDGKLDVVNAYSKFSIGDGTIILIDKMSNVAQVYNGTTTAGSMSSRINQLLRS